MNYEDKLKKTIRKLADAGETELVSDLLCAYAALTDSEMPRPDLTYSSVMRTLRKEHPDKVKEFLKEFKKNFDKAVLEGLDNVEELALLEAIKKIKVEL